MGQGPEVLERLRSRLEDVQERQRVSGATADPEFWERVAASPSVLPGATQLFGATSTGAAPGADSTARRPPVRARAVPPESRTAWRGTGPWSEVPTDELDRIDLLEIRPMSGDGFDEAAWVASVEERAAEMGAGSVEGPPRPAAGPDASLVAAAVTGLSLRDADESELGRAGEWIAHQRASHEVMLVNVVAELEARGVSAPDGLSRHDWLRAHDPSLTAAAARTIVKVAAAMAQPRWERLRMLIASQRLTVAKAGQIVEFEQRAARVADPGELGTAIDDIICNAPVLRPEELVTLIRHHEEQVKPPADDDRLDEGRRQSRGLWFGQPNETGMVRMRGTLDPEAAAVIKSAIDPLSMPCPTKDRHGHTIEPDPRTPAKRRADALVEVVARGVSAPDGVPTTDKAKVVVLIDWETLVGELRGTGRALSGDVLSPETVRRLACDAGVIPMVLGTKGEPLDVGRKRRLVTPGLRMALIARDKGCSFPGCSVPAQWADAHHVVPWYRGGVTSLLTLALLCRRHHTHVHKLDLTATVTATAVTWHV